VLPSHGIRAGRATTKIAQYALMTGERDGT
jgi:hypothetical protein